MQDQPLEQSEQAESKPRKRRGIGRGSSRPLSSPAALGLPSTTEPRPKGLGVVRAQDLLLARHHAELEVRQENKHVW